MSEDCEALGSEDLLEVVHNDSFLEELEKLDEESVIEAALPAWSAKLLWAAAEAVVATLAERLVSELLTSYGSSSSAGRDFRNACQDVAAQVRRQIDTSIAELRLADARTAVENWTRYTGDDETKLELLNAAEDESQRAVTATRKLGILGVGGYVSAMTLHLSTLKALSLDDPAMRGRFNGLLKDYTIVSSEDTGALTRIEWATRFLYEENERTGAGDPFAWVKEGHRPLMAAVKYWNRKQRWPGYVLKANLAGPSRYRVATAPWPRNTWDSWIEERDGGFYRYRNASSDIRAKGYYLKGYRFRDNRGRLQRSGRLTLTPDWQDDGTRWIKEPHQGRQDVINLRCYFNDNSPGSSYLDLRDGREALLRPSNRGNGKRFVIKKSDKPNGSVYINSLNYYNSSVLRDAKARL